MITDLRHDTLADALLRCPPHPFTRAAHDDYGLRAGTLDALVRAGLVVQPMRGILHRADLANTVELRAAVAALALPDGAALCRTTAAWLHGIDCRAPGDHLSVPDVECVVPSSRAIVERPGLRCYQGDLRVDDLREVEGLAVTTPDRTAVDLARYSVPGMGLGALDAMARTGLIRPDRLLADLERWRGERYIARARSLVGWCDPLAESFGESWLRLRILDAGFPRPQLQIQLPDRDGVLIYRIDLGYEEVRTGWEYDGEDYHLGPEREAADRRRRQEIQMRWGWNVVGVGKALVLGPSMAIERAVGEALTLEPQIRRRRW